MPPIPVTPTPQRFLPKSARKSREIVTSFDGPSDEEHDRLKQISAGSKTSFRGDAQEQFGVTPKFTFKSSSRPAPIAALQETPLRVTPAPVEDVLDTTQSDNQDDDPMLLDDLNESSSWGDELILSPKRRRLSGPSETPNTRRPGPPTFVKPAQPKSKSRMAYESSSQRFRSPSQSIQGRLNNVPSFAVNPAETRDTTLATPLPDAFSPQRKRDNYAPGGMASVMQQWVIETGQAALQSRRNQRESFFTTIKVASVTMRHDRAMAVSGVDANDDKVDALLVSGDTKHKAVIYIGDTLVMKQPTWPLTLQETTFMVCVDWKTI